MCTPYCELYHDTDGKCCEEGEPCPMVVARSIPIIPIAPPPRLGVQPFSARELGLLIAVFIAAMVLVLAIAENGQKTSDKIRQEQIAWRTK